MSKRSTLGLLVLAAALGAIAAAVTPTDLAGEADARRAAAPVADAISFCHADGDSAASAVVARQSSSVYSEHDAHGDCLVADGTEAGRVCDRADVDADDLCDGHGDPSFQE